jgi:diketogulonate reductase-like aldo/keto reductase
MHYIKLPSGSIPVDISTEDSFFSKFDIDQLHELKQLVEIKILSNKKLEEQLEEQQRSIVQKLEQNNKMLAEMNTSLEKKKEMFEEVTVTYP